MTDQEAMDRIVAHVREIGATGERNRIAQMLRERGELALAIEVLKEPEAAQTHISK